MNRRKNLIVAAILALSLIAGAGPARALAASRTSDASTAKVSIADRQFGNTGIEQCRANIAPRRSSALSGIVPKALVWDCSQSTTLTADTTYDGDVQIDELSSSGSAVTLDLNGQTLTVNGDLFVFGTLFVNNGTLVVHGSVTISGGLLKMTEAGSTVTIYGSFTTAGRDHTGALSAGTLDVRGDFLQYNYNSDKAFCPTGTLKVKLSGANRLVYFDSPAGSWLGSYAFASGTTFNAGSVFSMSLNLSSDTVLTSLPHLYIRGQMNGNDLTVPANTVVSGPLTLGGGRLTANGSFSVNNSGGIAMTNSADYIDVEGSFSTGGAGNYAEGTLEIHGNFVQFGAVSGSRDDSFVGQPAHKTKIIGTNCKILFQSPATSYFGQLDTSAATWTSDSVVSMNCNLTGDTTLSYPVLYFGGSLGGKSLTVLSSLYARQIVLGGGSLTVAKDFTAIATDCLIMHNSSDSVLVKGNFLTTYSMSPGSITAGTLELRGNFSQSGSETSFLASGSHKTILSGTSMSVVFTNPGQSCFNKVELAKGASLASTSVLSINGGLASNLTVAMPMVYFGGDMGGYTLDVTGSLHLIGNTNPDGGIIKTTGNVTLDGTLTMSSANDRLEVGGAFTGTGTAVLSAGTAEYKGSFDYSGMAYNAADAHTTILSGGADMTVKFEHPSQSWFSQTTVSDDTTLSSSSVLSIKTAGQSDMAYTVPRLYLQGNLNGKKLALTGSMTIPSGGLTIGGGALSVSGNLLVSNGLLVMTNSADTVTVGGNFTAKGLDETDSLTKGKLIIKGNFLQKSANSDKSFVATGSHSTIFSGTQTQSISFESPDSSTFYNLYILNDLMDYQTLFHYAHKWTTSADLLTLTGTGGKLYPNFSPDVTDYVYLLPKDVTATQIDAEKKDQSSITTLSMNGQAVSSLALSNVPYDGSTAVSIVISDADGIVTKTYTVKVERENADLASIGLSGGTLAPAFSADTTDYTVTLPASIASVTVTPVADHPDAAFTINNAAAASTLVALDPGKSADVSIKVTGQKGVTTKTYTVHILRNAMLTGIDTSLGSLAPSAQNTLNLTALQDTVTLTPQKADATVSYTIDGKAQASAQYTLALGEQKQAVIIAKAGSATYTYTVTIRRAAIIKDIYLSSGATMSPAFKATGGSYSLTIPASMLYLTVSPQLEQCTKLTIDDDTSDSTPGITQNSVTVHVAPGCSQTISIVAQAGPESNPVTVSYLLTVTKKPIVTALTLSSGTLTPAFSPDILSYTVEQPATMDAMTVQPTLASGTAKVLGTPCIPLAGSYGIITVVGTDGAESVTYQITIHCHKPISGIKLSTGSLSETFNAAVASYSVLLPASAPQITITPTKTAQCTALTINGVAQDSVTLTPAMGTSAKAVINATGPDGKTITAYTIEVTREALLSNIKTSTGTLSPVFSGSTLNYNVYLPNTTTSITLTPTKTASCTSFTINGQKVASIVLKPASGGSATATIAAAGSNASTRQTYTVTVYRIAPVTGIKLSTGTLSPVFATKTTAYTVNIPATTKSLTVTAQKGASCTSLQINGVSATSAVLSPQIGGSAKATITATAADGSVYTYTVTVNRAALLKKISVSKGTLTPSFSATTLSYTVTVPASATSVKVTATKATTGVKSMKINGKSVTSLTLKPPVGGSATATITLIAKDGTTKQTYTVKVIRGSLVSGITTSAGTLSPAFSATTTAYTVSLPADTASTTITVTKAASGVKSLTINGTAALSKVVSMAPGGSAKLTIIATSTNGTTKYTYMVTVKRAGLLSGIKLSTGSLNTAFSAATTSYTLNLPATTGSVTVTPVRAAACTSLTIDGVALPAMTYILPVGGSVTAKITAKTALGLTVTYTIKITRAALVKGIRTSTTSCPLSPAFSATTLNYTVSIPASRTSITIYATKASSGVKSLTMNGKAVTSLVVKPAKGGSVKVVIVAIASDGKTKVTYTVTVKRAS